MAVDISALDANEQPPDNLRAIWKAYSKIDRDGLLAGSEIDDLASQAPEFRRCGSIPSAALERAFSKLEPGNPPDGNRGYEDAPIYHHLLLPGLCRPSHVRG